MKNNEYASEKLKKLRARRNLTQQELADDLGIIQQNIARYENGQRQFKPDFLVKLADYFNVPISYFFEEDNEDNKQTEHIPVYESLNFKKINEYLEIPKSWLKNKNNVFCIKLNGNVILYKKDNNEYLVFERNKK